MQQTANYQLNQWQKQDRILMSDFNADNQKLDAALAAEVSARKSADAAETAARKSADAAETAARKSADAAETAARKETDASLDARLTTLAAETKPRFLQTMATSADASAVTFQLPDVDWGAWSAVHILVTPKIYNVSPVSYSLGGNSIDSVSTEVHLVLYPIYTAGSYLTGLFFSAQGSKAFCQSVRYTEITALKLSAASSSSGKCILAGTEMCVWGVK